MTLLAPLQDLIRKLDTEASGELAALKADFEGRLARVLPVLAALENDVRTAVSDVAEQAGPGLRAALAAAVATAENDLKTILGL